MVAETQDRLATYDLSPEADDASAPFVGKWNRLVSRTNWEKGRIVCQWREALVESGASANDYSDEAWAIRVGGVSAGHVGRLRRVWQRFGDSCENFDGLYWTHFLVAMDWDDAEMWLEGAAQSDWSVSQMRAQRWEVTGELEESTDGDETTQGDWDEDSPLMPVGDALRVTAPAADGAGDAEPENAEATDSNGAANPSSNAAAANGDTEGNANDGNQGSPTVPVQPFANLPDLPDDLAEAFEQFKIAILAHRMCGWQEISSDEVLASLDALKALVRAPIDDDS